MSCRHDLALGTCSRCYPETGTIDPGEEESFEPNMEGPGAVTKEAYLQELLRTPEGRAKLAATMAIPVRCPGKDYPG